MSLRNIIMDHGCAQQHVAGDLCFQKEQQQRCCNPNIVVPLHHPMCGSCTGRNTEHVQSTRRLHYTRLKGSALSLLSVCMQPLEFVLSAGIGSSLVVAIAMVSA